MAIIGAFKKSSDGAFVGSLKTLTLDLKQIRLQPASASSDKGPDYRIIVGQTECGAAWNKVSRDGRNYLSVKLDDPGFVAPIFATLVESEDGHNLIWSRRSAAD